MSCSNKSGSPMENVPTGREAMQETRFDPLCLLCVSLCSPRCEKLLEKREKRPGMGLTSPEFRPNFWERVAKKKGYCMKKGR